MLVTPIRAVELAGFQPDPSTAVLRIYDPIDAWEADAAEQAQAGWGAFLGLAFWDIDGIGLGLMGALVARLLGRHRALCLRVGQKLFGDDIPWRPFLAADACDIAAFADGLAGKGIRNLLVVCRNGRGRSGTVGQWIARRIGATFTAHGPAQQASAYIAASLTKCDHRPSCRPPSPPAVPPTYGAPA